MASIKQHTLFWGSSYDRGLDTLLFLWPDIKEKFPDAVLHICYGWNLFDKANHDNPERMSWKKQVQMLMAQEGIVHHGRVGKKELQDIRRKCGIWAYPTAFQEINCITALDCQKDGAVPVTMDSFAMKETVGSGIKISGDITDVAVKDKFLKELLDLMGNEGRHAKEVKKGRAFAKDFLWKNIAGKWKTVFDTSVEIPLLSVITITIREGWWNIMADNLSRQTYKNFEWIIVDDYKKDRSKIADEYAKRYGLNIRYIRGDKALGKYKRKHGLVRANNMGWRASKGELCVFIQDFIIIPEDGLETIVGLYRHNKDALIAPVDEYWFPKKPNKSNKKDWWDNNVDILDRFSWRNIRVQFSGIRETENPSDFEMNYSAIPKAILDHLNGWYEFFDDGMGYDNVEIAHRALGEGYRILIDDTNIATCIDIGHHGFPLNTEGWDKFLTGDYPNVRKDNE